MTSEWYRDPAWEASDRADFERRLSKAQLRNRPEYLRIKAGVLQAAGHDAAAAQLLERIVSDHGDAWSTVNSALEGLGDLERARGRAREAEAHYRDLLASGRSLSGTSGMVEVSLAEILIDRGDRQSAKEAAALLRSWTARPGGKFTKDLFRWNLAALRIEEQTGDREAQRHYAKAALALVETGPQLPGHPTVGLVKTDATTLRRLRDIALDLGRDRVLQRGQTAAGGPRDFRTA